jgi:hypothetical protein
VSVVQDVQQGVEEGAHAVLFSSFPKPAYKFCRKCGTPNGGGQSPAKAAAANKAAAASKSSTGLSRTSISQKMEKPEVLCGDCKSDNPSGYKVRLAFFVLLWFAYDGL